MTNKLQHASVGIKAIVKLARLGGVVPLSEFTKAEARRLTRADDYTRVSRFNSAGPLMVEIHAAGWVKFNTYLSGYCFSP